MILRQPRSTLTDTLFPYTTLFRSRHCSLFVPKYSRGRARVNDFPFPPRAGRGFQGLYGSGWQPRTGSNVTLRLATSGTEAVIVLVLGSSARWITSMPGAKSFSQPLSGRPSIQPTQPANRATQPDHMWSLG